MTDVWEHIPGRGNEEPKGSELSRGCMCRREGARELEGGSWGTGLGKVRDEKGPLMVPAKTP